MTKVDVLTALETRWHERPDETLGQLLEGLAPLDVLVALDDEQLLALLNGGNPEELEVANLQAKAAAFDAAGRLET